MKEGDYGVLHPMTPSVDLWRLVVRAIEVRGGLKRDGNDQLWIEWQPAHTRASTDETVEQKNRRRGNAAADKIANEGRRLHDNVENEIARVQYLHHVAKQCATWAGVAAALQYDDAFVGCDHDVKPKQQKQQVGRPVKVAIPDEARVLRKFPWATRSLGTAEYTGDIHHDVHVVDDPSVLKLAKAVRAATASTMIGVKYNDAFDKTFSSTKLLGKRLHTNGVPEHSQPLRQDEAYGHRLFVTGLKPHQYIYCERCHAYTGVRAQNLMRQCKGAAYPSRAFNRLLEGKHPDTGTMLSTLPRRITRRDVGLDIWNSDGLPSTNAYCESMDADFASERHSGCTATLHERCVALPPNQFIDVYGEEDDPLGLGNCLG